MRHFTVLIWMLAAVSLAAQNQAPESASQTGPEKSTVKAEAYTWLKLPAKESEAREKSRLNRVVADAHETHKEIQRAVGQAIEKFMQLPENARVDCTTNDLDKINVHFVYKF